MSIRGAPLLLMRNETTPFTKPFRVCMTGLRITVRATNHATVLVGASIKESLDDGTGPCYVHSLRLSMVIMMIQDL